MLQMVEMEKLGPPYDSHCTKDRFIGDVKNSIYSCDSCVDKCFAMKLKNKCGDVLEKFQDYVIETPDELKGDHNETISCFRQFYALYSHNSSFLDECVCPPPCKETFYEIFHKQVDVIGDENVWSLKIRFKSKMVKVIKEYERYSAEELISNVGGLCGLFLGMSMLSLAEIVFHSIISITKYSLKIMSKICKINVHT